MERTHSLHYDMDLVLGIGNVVLISSSIEVGTIQLILEKFKLQIRIQCKYSNIPFCVTVKNLIYGLNQQFFPLNFG